MSLAYEVGRQALPAYRSRYSRKDFTLPQLFACLALKTILKTDFRGAEVTLHDMPGRWDRAYAYGLVILFR